MYLGPFGTLSSHLTIWYLVVFYIRKYLVTFSLFPADQKFLATHSWIRSDFYRFRSVCLWCLPPNVILVACNSPWQCKTRHFSGKLLNLFRFQDDGVKLDPLGLLAGVCVFISSMVMQQPSQISIFAHFCFIGFFSFFVRLV